MGKINNDNLLRLVHILYTSDKNINFDEIFENEEEMIEKLLIFRNLDKEYLKNNYSIYENVWLEMLERYTLNNWELSEKQIKQLKRNCYLIPKQYNLYTESQRKDFLLKMNKKY